MIMLDDVTKKSLPIRANTLPEASSSSLASRSVLVRIEGLGRQKPKGSILTTASLGDADLDRQDDEISMAMTKAERLETCIELSDFCMELNRAHRRRHPVRRRAHSRA